MYFKPRPFRFGLIALFAVIAAVGILVSLWNPFQKPSRTNFDKIELGISEDNVRALVGQPDNVTRDNARGWLGHVYDVGNAEAWAIIYENGRVMRTFPFFHDAVPKTPNDGHLGEELAGFDRWALAAKCLLFLLLGERDAAPVQIVPEPVVRISRRAKAVHQCESFVIAFRESAARRIPASEACGGLQGKQA